VARNVARVEIGGGSDDKPVGTVWFAWAMRETQSSAHRELFSGDRGAVREQAVAKAIQGVLALVDKK